MTLANFPLAIFGVFFAFMAFIARGPFATFIGFGRAMAAEGGQRSSVRG
eukprot:CAMPEP_0171230314 /NCGR_PEP_ID=MMETSP0790-20130122/39332_1 /TAXON_ID=2925 /ORGANISM="Alexandrium catenella, Strain OF101" /LENGTH=48 /DNA_ID= /DNA_START= /DNA_END= /DNA_ORIENTATION=